MAFQIGGAGCTLPSATLDLTTAEVDDFEIAGTQIAAVVRVQSTQFLSTTITGFPGGEDGRLIWILNVGGNTVTIGHDHAGSSAANRFECALNNDVSLGPGAAFGCIYDPSSGRWQQTCRS